MAKYNESAENYLETILMLSNKFEAVTCHAPKKLATGVGIFRGGRLLHRKKACSEWVQTRKCQTLRLLQVDTSARLS